MIVFMSYNKSQSEYIDVFGNPRERERGRERERETTVRQIDREWVLVIEKRKPRELS